MKKSQMILKSVLEKIKPSKKELKDIDFALLEFQSKLRPLLKKYNAKIFIGGSLAKKTLIKKVRYDIDVFILFPYKRYEAKSHLLSSFLKSALKTAKFKYITLKGSRDYFQININNLIIEVIPILDIQKAKQARNITDISPLHVFYILKKQKKKNTLADEIMLAKAFSYACNCYGAESYISGFSGYALEILTCHHGSFLNLIKKAARWQENKNKKIVIDPEKYYKNQNQILEQLNTSKKASPLILVDPVQQDRNVTAALSKETLEKFIDASRKFIKNPSESLFFKQDLDEKKLLKEAKNKKALLINLEVKSTKNKIDIAGAKLKKFFNFLSYKLEKEGFCLIKKEMSFDEKSLKAKFYFVLKQPEKGYTIYGPPISIDKKYQENFKKRWKKTFIQKGRLCAKTQRRFLNFKDFLKSIDQASLKEMNINEVKTL